ncbi:hypothetical protein B0T24DRAFT_221427 [Lasiosphaeria ovina]|uniref:G domain-containing protein n=1 Tax=Lasiosphaeria ovina TaxID=92902 RepID=A0AAE0NA74_9PEZI|nr:hypothetical protein B0T24DRAFT_221427 [Lasiosphaeria ovina]
MAMPYDDRQEIQPRFPHHHPNTAAENTAADTTTPTYPPPMIHWKRGRIGTAMSKKYSGPCTLSAQRILGVVHASKTTSAGSDILIAVIGVTGAGKTSFIIMATNRKKKLRRRPSPSMVHKLLNLGHYKRRRRKRRYGQITQPRPLPGGGGGWICWASSRAARWGGYCFGSMPIS